VAASRHPAAPLKGRPTEKAPQPWYRSIPVPRLDLLTVGEAFEDLIFVGLERLPRPGEEVKTSRFVRTLGGGAVISAVAAARLGVRCGIVSGLGRDAAAHLRREGVHVTNLRRAGEPHAVTAALSTRFNRSFVTFNGINDLLEPRLLDAIDRMTARHVHFAFYPKACGRWESVVERLRAAGVTTSWDFGWNEPLLRDPRFLHLVNRLDYVFFNEQEAVLYARRLTLQAALDVWRAHPHVVVLKLGARGSRWIARGTDIRVPAVRVRAVDTTGAGDAFNGGFLAAMLAGAPPKACLKTGNVVGGLSTTAPGGIDGLPRNGRLLPARARRREAR
jgi:sugar/nucleoside kinase (ribokinase family)